MSEYWKSIPKYWCKHCKDFVTDTPLGRKNHDATAKHQSALKRFLRDLHRDNERAISATENAKREVARLNALVSGSSSSSPVPTLAVAKPQQAKGERWGVANRELTAEEKKRQMQELEALGVAMPEAFRGDLALPGEWTTVSVEEAKAPLTEKELLQKELAEVSQKEKEEAERKRKWDELDEDDKEIRSFKIQERTYPGTRDDEEVDVAALFAKKGKGKAKSPPGIATKVEESEDRTVDVKKEDEPPAGEGVVFKKRKVKTMRK
ncbi:hypothetical protein BDD12DRAFT_678626, partial [Trichophaea hybrida]